MIDSHLGLRSTLTGYQYSEIIRAIFSVFCCGGDSMEDLNLYLKDVLAERPHTRVPSADTVLRGIEELATENISYTAEKTGNVYDFNTAERFNQLLIKLLLATGQLAEGGEYDVDFDHQFLEAEKYDSKRTYKGFDGYSPGVFTIGGLIAYLENRDGNANVRFMQAETHRRGKGKVSAYKSSSSVSKPRVRQNHHKQGLNQTIEKLSADFRYYKMFFGKMSFYRLQSQ